MAGTSNNCKQFGYLLTAVNKPANAAKEMEAWDLFKIPATEKAKYAYDGHTPQDVLERLKKNVLNRYHSLRHTNKGM